MSNKINCKYCIHFDEIERRCCLNDGGFVEKECYFMRNNKKPMGADIILGKQKERMENLQLQLYQQKAMWQKLKEWLEKAILRNKDNIISKNDYENVLVIMQELEGEDESL